MQSYCPRCGKPRHIVGGKAVTRTEIKPFKGGDTIVETLRHVIEGKCEACGTMLRRHQVAVV